VIENFQASAKRAPAAIFNARKLPSQSSSVFGMCSECPKRNGIFFEVDAGPRFDAPNQPSPKQACQASVKGLGLSFNSTKYTLGKYGTAIGI
jgi:hypothetical protein